MARMYRQRHPERTVFYRVLFHYLDKFLLEYENRFEKEYVYFRSVIKEVVERYLDCGNPKCGFARVRCQDCGSEFLLHFSCRIRGFCPSCHAKRLEEWSEWMREGFFRMPLTVRSYSSFPKCCASSSSTNAVFLEISASQLSRPSAQYRRKYQGRGVATYHDIYLGWYFSIVKVFAL